MKKITSILLVILLVASATCMSFAGGKNDISVGIVDGYRGSSVEVPVYISGNTGFASAEMTVNYDASVLTLQGIRTGKMTGISNTETGFINHATATNVTGDGVLFVAVFKIADNAPSCGLSRVSVTVDLFYDEVQQPVSCNAYSGGVNINHSLGSGTMITKPTCTSGGEVLYTCTVCGEDVYEYLYPEEHTWSEKWYADHEGHWHVCEVCGEQSEKVAHIPDTEDANRIREYGVHCSDCGFEMVKPAGHTHSMHLTHVAKVSPDCSNPGMKEHYACDCGKYFLDAEGKKEVSKEDLMIAPLGHGYGMDNKCIFCGAKKPFSIIDHLICIIIMIILAVLAVIFYSLYKKEQKKNKKKETKHQDAPKNTHESDVDKEAAARLEAIKDWDKE